VKLGRAFCLEHLEEGLEGLLPGNTLFPWRLSACESLTKKIKDTGGSSPSRSTSTAAKLARGASAAIFTWIVFTTGTKGPICQQRNKMGKK
jgi:hypothetical protein